MSASNSNGAFRRCGRYHKEEGKGQSAIPGRAGDQASKEGEDSAEGGGGGFEKAVRVVYSVHIIHQQTIDSENING